jgi:Protein of unknown function (DUF3467)
VSEPEAGLEKATAGANTEPPTYCVNNAYASAGPWDVQIRFGHNTVTEDGVIQKWDVQIIQSPTQAKAFLRILAQQLMNFEKSYGPIPDVLAVMEKQTQQSHEEEVSTSSSLSSQPPSKPSRPAAPKKAPQRAGSGRSGRHSSPAKRRPT